MERDVRAVCRGVNQPHALLITPIGLLQSLIAVLRVFDRAALDGRGDRVWRCPEVVRGGRARWTSRLLVEGDHNGVQSRKRPWDLQKRLFRGVCESNGSVGTHRQGQTLSA